MESIDLSESELKAAADSFLKIGSLCHMHGEADGENAALSIARACNAELEARKGDKANS